ncbi:MAG: hypothetical protein ACTHJM_08865 [Marmoricola sp.]
MIQNGPQRLDPTVESIKERVAKGELSGAEGQRMIAERWGVDLSRVQSDSNSREGMTLFDATATQAYDDYLSHCIPPNELKQHLRGHQFFVPFPKGA